jgi:hypothetical protein
MDKLMARNHCGSSLAELAAGLLVAVPIFLALLDCGILMIGVAANDALCRDAARAAAAGPPSVMTAGERTVGGGTAPYTRARAIVERIYNLGIPARVRSGSIFVHEKIDSVVGGSINGTLTVSTTADINPPFIVGFVTHHSIAMSCSHTYPFTYTPPVATTGGGL